MKKFIIITFALLSFVGSASANIEDRVNAVKASVEGKHDYHANMARELATIADEEKSQNEPSVAGTFMKEAEKHASQARAK